MLIYTRKELEQLHKAALDSLIEHAGGQTHLAKMLNYNINTVKGWISRGRISKEGADKVNEHPTLKEKFKAEDLRPELY